MEKNIEFIQRENQQIVDLKEANKELFAKHPQLTKYVGKLPTFAPIYETNSIIANQDTKGATLSKKEDKEELYRCLYPLCIKLSIYAKVNHMNEAYVKMKFSKSDVIRMSIEKILTLTDTCVEVANSLSEKWEEIGIAQSDLDDLLSAKNKMEASKDGPEKIIKAKKLANSILEDTLKENSELIHQDIKPLMQAAFQEKNDIVWKEFNEIINSNIIRSKKLAVKGQIIDQETEQPILYAKMKVKELGTCNRLRSKKGNFQIRKLQPGNYTLEFTHEAYHPVRYTFTNRWGVTNELLVGMEMTDIAKKEKESKKKKEIVE